jgi:crotonobetainyl-CoA:carnitine CoA-transferase CaiB-like acyl-CoA transferase
MERPELAVDARYTTNAARVANRDTLIPTLRGLSTQRSTDDWIARLEAAGVPCGPINTLDRVFRDPQVIARGIRIEMTHPLAGALPLVASPMRLSGTPVEYRHPPPLLGEHTREVLAGILQLDATALDTLSAQRVI